MLWRSSIRSVPLTLCHTLQSVPYMLLELMLVHYDNFLTLGQEVRSNWPRAARTVTRLGEHLGANNSKRLIHPCFKRDLRCP